MIHEEVRRQIPGLKLIFLINNKYKYLVKYQDYLVL